MNNDIQQQQQGAMASRNPKTEAQSLKEKVLARREEWERAARDTGMSFDTFAAGIVTAVRNNPRLLEAGAAEIIGAADRARALGLDVSGVTGEAWLIGPLKRKGIATVEMWKGIKGVLKLAYRSGLIKSVTVNTVYDGDAFDVDLGREPPIRHIPSGNGGRIVAVYALCSLQTGGALPGIVWTGEVENMQAAARQRLGAAYDRSPWATNTEGMVSVAAVRRALKWAPQSVIQQELLGDDAPGLVTLASLGGDKASQDALAGLDNLPALESPTEAE